MKDELKEVFELADDLRSKVKKIIKKSKVDPDTVHYKVLPPGYEIVRESDGYYHSHPSTEEFSDTRHTRQAAVASAWALREELRTAKQGIADSDIPQAIRDVLAERKRQTEVKGWMQEHEDSHGRRELSDAAAAYLLYEQEIAADIWPFESAFCPKNHRDNVVTAGALIIAEIERLDRLAAKEADHE